MHRTTQILSEVLETNLRAFARAPVHTQDSQSLLRLDSLFKDSLIFNRILEALGRDICELFNTLYLTHDQFISLAVDNRRGPTELEYNMINSCLMKHVERSQTHKISLIRQSKQILQTVRELMLENNPAQVLLIELNNLELMLDDLHVLLYMMTLSLTIPGKNSMLN